MHSSGVGSFWLFVRVGARRLGFGQPGLQFRLVLPSAVVAAVAEPVLLLQQRFASVLATVPVRAAATVSAHVAAVPSAAAANAAHVAAAAVAFNAASCGVDGEHWWIGAVGQSCDSVCAFKGTTCIASGGEAATSEACVVSAAAHFGHDCSAGTSAFGGTAVPLVRASGSNEGRCDYVPTTGTNSFTCSATPFDSYRLCPCQAPSPPPPSPLPPQLYSAHLLEPGAPLPSCESRGLFAIESSQDCDAAIKALNAVRFGVDIDPILAMQVASSPYLLPGCTSQGPAWPDGAVVGNARYNQATHNDGTNGALADVNGAEYNTNQFCRAEPSALPPSPPPAPPSPRRRRRRPRRRRRRCRRRRRRRRRLLRRRRRRRSSSWCKPRRRCPRRRCRTSQRWSLRRL